MPPDDYGVDDSGFRAPRAADEAVLMRDGIDAELVERGYPAVTWESDLWLSILVDITAVRLGAGAELTQAVYDAGSPNNATGVHADDIGTIQGVPRLPPTRSTVTVALGGTAGTIVVEGKRVRGGGEDGDVIWRVTEDCTIPGNVLLEALDVGAIEAGVGEVDTIVTPVAGWETVTNAAVATPGRSRETDAAYALRRSKSRANRGSGPLAAIQARLLELDFVLGAYVVNNRSASVATVAGLTLQPHSMTAVIHPPTLTDDQKQEVGDLIYRHLDPGVWMNGTALATVVRRDGFEETIRWSWSTTLTVNVVVTVVLFTGYVLADVEEPIETLIDEWWEANAMLGQAIDDIDLETEIKDTIAGVRRVTVTLNGDPTVEPNANEFPTLGTKTVTL